jgi:hypothetical protein
MAVHAPRGILRRLLRTWSTGAGTRAVRGVRAPGSCGVQGASQLREWLRVRFGLWGLQALGKPERADMSEIREPGPDERKCSTCMQPVKLAKAVVIEGKRWTEYHHRYPCWSKRVAADPNIARESRWRR